MGRLGIGHAGAGAFFHEMRGLSNIDLEGIMSHFASADELDEEGRRYTGRQAALFAQAVEEAKSEGFAPRYIHIANSAAAFSDELPFCNLVRPGITLYGALPSAGLRGMLDIRPVMRLRSSVAMLKWVEPGDSISYSRRYVAEGKVLVASVPVGYADGYPRSLTNRGDALIRGKRARVTGTVCMDWIMLDVTHIPGIAVGDEVTLLGCDHAGECIHAEELAEKANTIPYEIFCCISKRVPRIYMDGSR
jgi:alanine racemase